MGRHRLTLVAAGSVALSIAAWACGSAYEESAAPETLDDASAETSSTAPPPRDDASTDSAALVPCERVEGGVTPTTGSFRVFGITFGDFEPMTDASTRGTLSRKVGFDLDGLCTFDGGPTSCTPPNQGKAIDDGDLGRDNGFARAIFSLSPTMNGSGTSADLETAGVYVEYSTGGAAFLTMSLGGYVMRLRVQNAVTDGTTLGGAISTAELLDRLRQIVGTFDPTLCNSSTTESILQNVLGSADLRLGADAGTTCNALSLALRWTTTASAVPPAPSPNSCP